MITAKQFAEELLKNPDDIICTRNFLEGFNQLVPSDHIHLSRFKGKIVKGNFMDAFDGTRYTSEVVEMGDFGEINFIEL